MEWLSSTESIIGAGHNGLTLAAYLTRAGLRIAVLERNPRIGGGASTEEPMLPGYKLNLHANFYMGIGLSPLLRDLELHRFGFSYIEPPVQQAAVFRDGTGIVVYKDLDQTCASLARFSKQDAETFRALWHTYCEEMRPLLVSLLYNAPMPREALIERLSGAKAKELLSHAQHDLFSVVRKHFVDERIRTLFTSYMHVITTENVPGAGIVFPAIFANIASFTLPAGGAVSLPLALARVVEAGGGEIVTGADVREINGQQWPRHRREAGGWPHRQWRKIRRQCHRFSDHGADGRGGAVSGAGARESEILALGQPQPGDPASGAEKSAGLSRRGFRSRCRRAPTIFSSAWTTSTTWPAALRIARRKNFPRS